MHERRLVIGTDAGPVTLIAAAPRDVVRRPVLGALTPLLATLALLGAVLAAAALAQIRLGLRPLRRLRDGMITIRAGDADRLSTDQPEELLPLAEELNALLRDNEAALATARATAANLAHALKTPVATLSLELRGDPRLAQIERIDTTIRHSSGPCPCGGGIDARRDAAARCDPCAGCDHRPAAARPGDRHRDRRSRTNSGPRWRRPISTSWRAT